MLGGGVNSKPGVSAEGRVPLHYRVTKKFLNEEGELVQGSSHKPNSIIQDAAGNTYFVEANRNLKFLGGLHG